MMAAATAMMRVAAEPVVHIVLAFFDVIVDDLGAGGGAHLLAAIQNAEALDARYTGGKVFLAQLLAGVGVAVHARAKDGQQHDEHDEDEAQHGALLAEEADAGIFPEALGRKVGVHGDLIVVVLEGEIRLVELVLGVQTIYGLGDGGGGGFAAQPDRFFCHISRPPLPNGCAGQ